MGLMVISGVDYGRDLKAKITGCDYFTYGDVVSSELAVRKGIKNIPTEAEWKNAEYAATHLAEPAREKFGNPIIVNSWYRCKALNDAAGSSDASFHRTGGGIDMDSNGKPLIELLEAVYSLPEWSEIIAEFFPHGWVHGAVLKSNNNRKLKLKDNTHNFSRVTIEELKKLYGKKG